MKTTTALVLASALLAVTLPAQAQGERPWKNGPVVDMTYVRTEPGRFDDYMKHLAGPYKASMEANIKAGLVLSHQVLSVSPRTPEDANVVLIVTYPNMAALDKGEEFDKVMVNLGTTIELQNKATAERGAMRKVLGSSLMREVILK